MVHAITHEAHYVTFALQGVDDAFLMHRGQLGEDAGRTGGLSQFGLAQCFDLRAKQDLVHRHAHLFTDVGSDDFIVAGQNLHVHIQSMEPLQSLGGGLFGRIEEGHIPQQGQVRFVLNGIMRLVVVSWKYSIRNGDDAETFLVRLLHTPLAMFIMLGRHSQDFTLDFNMGRRRMISSTAPLQIGSAGSGRFQDD